MGTSNAVKKTNWGNFMTGKQDDDNDAFFTFARRLSNLK